MKKASCTLQQARSLYSPRLPSILGDLSSVTFDAHLLPAASHEASSIQALFPHTFGRPLLTGKRGGGPQVALEERVGVVFSGGQASGGHNVITGLYDALKKLNPNSKLFGFLGGPSGIISGKSIELNEELLKPYRNQGGFDLIGSGRTKIESEEQLNAALASIKALRLTGLVIIGGDDSNTNAALLAEYFLAHECQTTVVGVPKTIDGDLKNEYVATSFGFDTACKVYAEMIGNIARDALSAKKYTHFIKLMGRSASHIALECALSVQPNMTLISEEVAEKGMTLSQITEEIANLIVQRAALGKNYGVILIPEGLIEFIPEVKVLISELNTLLSGQESCDRNVLISKLSLPSAQCFASLPESIQKQLLLSRDPHGNVQVSLIETERLLIETVSHSLEERKKQGTYLGTFSPQSHFLGYEGRAAYPSNFDCLYCTALGHVAALLIRERATGSMCYVSDLHLPVDQWQMGGIPITTLMHMELRKGKLKPVIQKALVDLNGKAFNYFKQHQDSWASQDAYLFPGPIQFSGDPQLTDSLPISIAIAFT